MKIEYISNNGYIVETDKAVYVFDFVDGLLPSSYFRKEKPFIFFVSNNNAEYYSQGIYFYRKTVIYSFDIPQDPYNQVFKMSPGDMVHLGFAKVHAFSSTREGVSYLIEEDDHKIFHAGSLNNWHYQDNYSEKRVQMETENFLGIIDSLKAYLPIDVMIFPVNASLGYNYDHGAKRVVRLLKPKHFFPTQFNRVSLIEEFVNWAANEKETKFYFPKYTNEDFEVQND